MTPVMWGSLAVGLVLTVWGLWERAGTSGNARAWTRVRSERRWRTAMFVRPGIGVLALGIGTFPLVEEVPVLPVLVGVVLSVVLALTFWWGILAFPCPLWAVPRHARGRWQDPRGWRDR